MDDIFDLYRTPKAPPKPKDDADGVASVLDDEFSKLGYPSTARLSILGDVGRENNWNRNIIFGGHNDPKNDARNRGIISWQGDRRANLDNYLKKQGVLGKNDDNELRAMARFMDEEIRSQYPDVHKTLTNPKSTYDASEALRKYIKYDPGNGYNTPDSQFRVKNNRIWAERAKKMGLGSVTPFGSLDEAISAYGGEVDTAEVDTPEGDVFALYADEPQTPVSTTVPPNTFLKPGEPLASDAQPTQDFSFLTQGMNQDQLPSLTDEAKTAIAGTPLVAPNIRLEQPTMEQTVDPTLTEASDANFKAANDYLQSQGQPLLTREQFNAAQTGGTAQATEYKTQAVTPPQTKKAITRVPTKQTAQNAQKPQETPTPPTAQGVEISFKYDPKDKRTYGEQERDAMASQFAGQLGIDADIVRDYINRKGFAEGNESESDREAQAKAGVSQRRKLDASAVADLVKIREFTVKKRAEIEKEAQEKLTQYTNELEEGMPTSVARIRTEFDMGGMSEDEFLKRITEEKELAKNLRSQSLDASPLDLRGITATRLGVPDSKVGGDVNIKENNKFIDSILERYPTLTAWKKEQDRLKEEYKYRPLAAPLEFAKGVYGAVPKAVASILKSADLASNLDPLVMAYRAYKDEKPFQFKEGVLSDIGNSINKYVDSTLNKDFDDSRAIRVISDTIGQVLTQVAAGILTGGATAPTALGFTMGASAQFDEANKFKNATDEQKAIAWAVGGLAAVPDAVIFSKGGVGGVLAYTKGLTKSLLARFGVQYGEKAAAEMTEIAMKSFAKRFMANAPKNAAFEVGQEVSENKINNAVAAITYDPSEKRIRDANPLHWTEEDTWSAVGAIVGGGGSAVIQAKIDSIPEIEREDFIDELSTKVDELVKQKGITPEQAAKAKREIVTLKPVAETPQTEKPKAEPTKVEPEAPIPTPEVKTPIAKKFSDKPLKEVQAEGEKEYGGVDDFFAVEEAPTEVADKPVENKVEPAPVAKKLDAVKELNKQKREALAEIEDEAKSLEAQGKTQEAKKLRDDITAEYNAKILEAKKKPTVAPTTVAIKKEPIVGYVVSYRKQGLSKPQTQVFDTEKQAGSFAKQLKTDKTVSNISTERYALNEKVSPQVKSEAQKVTKTIGGKTYVGEVYHRESVNKDFVRYTKLNGEEGNTPLNDSWKPVSDTMMQATNASGESAASLEAQSRLKGEQARGEYRVLVDTRSGAETKLIGVNAVDHFRLEPYQQTEWRGGNRDGEIIDRGTATRAYTRKKDTMMMVAWHGSPHKFDKFDSSKIGTGEGNQMYGHGLYFTDSEGVANHYRPDNSAFDKSDRTLIDGKTAFSYDFNPYDVQRLKQYAANPTNDAWKIFQDGLKAKKSNIEKQLAENPKYWSRKTDIKHLRQLDALLAIPRESVSYKPIARPGAKYRVDLKPADDEYLLWDKPLSEQSEKVKKAVDVVKKRLANNSDHQYQERRQTSNIGNGQITGAAFYNRLNMRGMPFDTANEVSEYLKSLGIRGIKYLDGTSRSKGEGSYNYVIFDAADVEITEVMQRAIDELNKAQASFKAARKLSTKALVEQSNFTKNARIAEGGIIAVDQIPEIELIRRIMGEGTQFYGVMADPNKVAKFNDTLDKMIAHSDNPNLKRLKRLVNTALKHDGTVIFAMSEETVPEEKAHRALYGNRQNDRASQIAPDVQKSIAESDVFKNATKFQEAYKGFSEAGKVEEFAVKSSLGQWGDLGITSEADKRAAKGIAIDFYESYAEVNKGTRTKEDILNTLSTEIAYAEEFKEYKDQEVRGNKETDKSADADSVVESPPREKDRPDAERGRESKPDGVKVKERQTVKTAHEYGVLNKNNTAGDVRYYTEKQTDPIERAAQDYVEQVGFNNAFSETILSPVGVNDVVHLSRQMAVIQLLDQQAQSARNAGNVDLYDYYEAQSQAVMRALAPDATEAGRFIQYLSKWKITNPATVLARVKLTRVQNGLPAKMDGEMEQKLVAATEKLQQAQAVIDTYEARIRDLENKESYEVKGRKTKPLTRTEKKVLDTFSKASAEALARLQNHTSMLMAIAYDPRNAKTPLSQQVEDDIVTVGVNLLLNGWHGKPITQTEFDTQMSRLIGSDYTDHSREIYAKSVTKMDESIRAQKKIDEIAKVKGEVGNELKSNEEISAIITERKAAQKDNSKIRAEHRKAAKKYKADEMYVRKVQELHPEISREVMSGVLMRREGASSPHAMVKNLREEYPEKFRQENTDSPDVRHEKLRSLNHTIAESEKAFKATNKALSAERVALRDSKLTPEQRTELEQAKAARSEGQKDLTNLVKEAEVPKAGVLRGIAQVSRASKTALVQTAANNLISAKIEQTILNKPVDTMDITLQRIFKGLKNEGLTKDASIATAWWTPNVDKTVSDVGVRSFIKGFSKHEILLRVIDENPEYFAKFFGDISPDFHSGVSKTLDKLMIPMRIQEFFMRDSEGVKALAQRAAMKGLDFKKILEDGDYAAFDKADIEFALKRALDLTYASRPQHGEGLTASVFTQVASALRYSGLVDLIASEEAPFLNFMYNTINKYKTKVPVMAQLRSAYKTAAIAKKLKRSGEEPHYIKEAFREHYTSRQIADQMWGVMVAGIMLMAVRSLGDADDWYLFKIPYSKGLGRDGGYMYFDIRTQPMLAPIAFLANKFNRLINGKDAFTYDGGIGELAEPFLGMSYRNNIENSALNQAALNLAYYALDDIKGGEDVEKNWDKFIHHISRWGGNTVGTLTNFFQFKTMKDIATQFDTDEQTQLRLTDRPFLQGIDARLPESKRILRDLLKLKVEEDLNYATGAKEPRNQYPILKILGFNLRDEADVRKEPTQAEMLANKLAWKGKAYKPPVLPDEVKEQDIKRDFRKAGEKVSSGDFKTQQALMEKMKEYGDILQPGQMKYAEDKLFTSGLEDNFTQLSWEDAGRVYQAGTPEEKKLIEAPFRKKLLNVISDKDKGEKDKQKARDLMKKMELNKVPSTGVDAMLNAPEMKNATSDEMVEVMKLEGYTPEEKQRVADVLRKKADNAAKGKTLTPEELQRVKEVLPDYAPPEKKEKGMKSPLDKYLPKMKLADLAYAKDGGSDFEERPIEYPDSPEKWKGQRLSQNVIDKRKGSPLSEFIDKMNGGIESIRQAKFEGGTKAERQEARQIVNDQIAETRYVLRTKGADPKIAKQLLTELLKVRSRF